MEKYETVCCELPFELWRGIFRDILGSSLPDVDQTSLQDYVRLLPVTDRDLLRQCARLERKRGVLRLVSRYWKAIIDRMGDTVFFDCETGLTRPPNSDISRAMRIYYLSKSSHILVKGALQQKDLWPRFMAHWKARDNLPPLCIDDNKMASHILHVNRRDIVVPANITTPRVSILALSWILTSGIKSLKPLTSVVFKYLVALHLTVYDLSSSAREYKLFLPKLRYLSLHTKIHSLGVIAESSFPALRFLDLDKPKCSDVLCKQVRKLFIKHAKTIQEIKLSSTCEHYTLLTCLRDFSQLQVWIVADVQALLYALSSLPWTFTGLPAGPPRLQIESAECMVSVGTTTAHALQLYRLRAYQIVIEMQESWEEMQEKLPYSLPVLELRLEFTRVLDLAQIRIFDSKGSPWRSKASVDYVTKIREMQAFLTKSIYSTRPGSLLWVVSNAQC